MLSVKNQRQRDNVTFLNMLFTKDSLMMALLQAETCGAFL
jgi:hypothetical protein